MRCVTEGAGTEYKDEAAASRIVPIDLPDTGDTRFDGAAQQVETDRIAQADPTLDHAVLDRHLHRSFRIQERCLIPEPARHYPLVLGGP